MAFIYNKSLSEIRVPEDLKSEICTPLLKKEGLDRDDLGNFRLISNVSLITKMLVELGSERPSDHRIVISTLPAVQWLTVGII